MAAITRKLACLIFFVLTFNIFQKLKAQADSSIRILQNETIINSDQSVLQTTHFKPHFIANLPVSLNETSGLLFFNGQLWSFNDSGNKPEIYQLDSTNGTVLRTVVVRNTINTD